MRSRYQYTLFDLLLAVLAWGAGAAFCFARGNAVDAMMFLVIWALAIIGGSALGLQIANGLGIGGGLKRCAILVLGWVYIPAALVSLWCSVVLGGFLCTWFASLIEHKNVAAAYTLEVVTDSVLILSITLPLVIYVWRLNRTANAAFQRRGLEQP